MINTEKLNISNSASVFKSKILLFIDNIVYKKHCLDTTQRCFISSFFLHYWYLFQWRW